MTDLFLILGIILIPSMVGGVIGWLCWKYGRWRLMSVESNLSWTPQFGDVGENKNLPVPVLADPEKIEQIGLPAGEARESTTKAGPTSPRPLEAKSEADSRGWQSLSYKDELTRAMDELAKDPLIRFVGYGVKIGRAMGTLKNVPDSQLIEMPVAENLMVGFAIGLALKGLKPVVFIERFDFILNALDAIVNHLDKIGEISHGEFKPTMILRIVAGNRQKPLFTGKTHTQDFSVALRALVSFPVLQLMEANQIGPIYQNAHAFLERGSSAIIEYKDLI